MTATVSRFGAVALVLASAICALTACSRPAEPSVEAGAATADARLAEIEAALAQMNYGEAAGKAREAQTAFPGDARLHLAAAKAEARLNDAEASAAALERARATGLSDVSGALNDPAFNDVRSHKAFAKFVRPAPVAPSSALPRKPENRIRAGDVEIIESADGDYVRAGDVVLDTRH